MDFTDFTTNFAQAEKDFRLAYSFCTLQSNQCVCNPADRMAWIIGRR
jgi:hypothetical protein